MGSNQEEVNEVYENLFTRLWTESCGEYLNFGMFHDSCRSLTEANDHMVNWIVENLKLDSSSRLLDIGCGRGKYTIDIASKSGCQFVGIDIVEMFVENARDLQKKSDLSEKGRFIQGDMLQLSDILKDEKFTHVIALGCLFYVHNQMPQFLAGLVPHTNSGTTLLIHDFSRNVPAEQVKDVMKHWRTTAETLETMKYLEIIKLAGFELASYSDDTKMGLRSVQWVVDTVAKVAPRGSPNSDIFTFWVLRDAMKARRILHNTIIAIKS